jgi:3-hydroxyisobutyrate dehydrogenase
MVGADAATFARAQPILAVFGKRIEHVGPVGTGDALKAVNNALLAVNILALGEGLAALVKAGVAPRIALEVINGSSGRSFVSEVLVPERVLTGAWPRTFRLALLD